MIRPVEDLTSAIALLIAVLILATAGDIQADQSVQRFATFNVSMYRDGPEDLQKALESGDDPQIRSVAEIIQRVDPDVLLLNEFDYDGSGRLVDLFRDNYLQVSQNGKKPVNYPHAYFGPVNTGVDSGFDLDRDGSKGGPADAWGYGRYEGQYGMLVLSRHEIVRQRVRTFRNFRWRDMPGALLPDDPRTEAKADWYSEEALEKFPLSSKSHWDVPIRVGDRVVHLLASHPTPPVFDGDEDRNGRRNHDEVRFWRDYITSGSDQYIYDDNGNRGGLAASASFVIAGDLNSDPNDGDSTNHPIRMLLRNKRVNAANVPESRGAVEAALLNPKANAMHRGEARFDTGDFGKVGNLRLDYVLPSNNLNQVVFSRVYWPEREAAEAKLAAKASDHRMVWIDIVIE